MPKPQAEAHCADRVPHPEWSVLYSPAMDALTLFGLFAVTAMLVCYAFDEKSPWWGLGFAGACLLGSTYGFLQGAWPFGLVEGIWALIALRRWYQRRRIQ